MQALIIIDVQNEFSPDGQRPVPDFYYVVETIDHLLRDARRSHQPVAWVRHFNKPDESRAFIEGSWGAEFFQGYGPQAGSLIEKEFQKHVYGAFSGSSIGAWLDEKNVDDVLIVGFYTHGCVSTTAREAIMKGLRVTLDPEATATCEITDEILGTISADEAKRSSLLALKQMGATIKRYAWTQKKKR